MKPTRHIVKPNRGLWIPKRNVWFKKNEDYPCPTCGDTIEYTGEVCHGHRVVKHQHKEKATECEKIRDHEYRTKRANKLWGNIEKKQND